MDSVKMKRFHKIENHLAYCPNSINVSSSSLWVVKREVDVGAIGNEKAWRKIRGKRNTHTHTKQERGSGKQAEKMY